jgi:protein SCO1/2
VKIIAVSVDPNGDRPAYVRKYLAARRLLRDVSYLVGTRRELTPVWRAYHMLAVPEAKSELVSHSAVVYGIDAGGVMRTLYPGNPIDRRALAHDALVLAKR